MFHLCSFTIIGIVLIYSIESAVNEKFITGKVTHVGSNHIDKNSRVEVTLRDISLMDTAAKLIASTTISDAKTFPLSYKLTYNPSDIEAGHTYAMSVRINGAHGKLLFINDFQTRAKFIGSTAPVVDVAVIRVGESSSTSVTKPNDEKVCGPVKCHGGIKTCPYGYQKMHGCEICRCYDPCNPPGKPILCGRNQRCFIDKKSDGTFETRCGTSSSKKHNEKKMDSKITCNQPKAIGQCKASFERFYYNPITKNCESFIYRGCQGNANNFHTISECEKTCRV